MYKIQILSKAFDTDIDLNKSYDFAEAVKNVKTLRSKGLQAELYPEQYSGNVIPESSAFALAEKIYQTAKTSKPNNYGELSKGNGSPVFYNFYCRDYEKEANGLAPGHFTILIDKLSGKVLSKEEFMEYQKLNYSF
jgi:hypothetical protein